MKNKKKIKIAIFHLAFIYSGGGEKLVLQEYDGLKKKGFDVCIYTTVIDKSKSFPDIIFKYKIKTFLPRLKIFKNHEVLQTVLSCILAPLFAYKFKNYDLILACNQPSPWIAYIIKLIYGVPYITYLAQPTRFLHPRSIDKKTGLFFAKHANESISARLMMNNFKNFSNWADKISIKNSSRILVNGEYMCKVIKKIYDVETINCPSGVKNINNTNIKKNNYLLVTNRHFAQKRIEYAIFALSILIQKYPKYRLIVTGTYTEYTHSLINLVNELGLAEKVNFVGYVKENELKNLYRKAKVYLYTAPEEDFGMGIVEAMSSGTPIVAWNAKGPAKIIKNGHDGLLALPYQIEDFTLQIEKILNDRKTSNLLIKNALNTVNLKYNTKNHIDTILQSINYVKLNSNERKS